MKRRDKKQGRSEGGIYCPDCGKEIPEDSLYCEYCGAFVPDEEASEGNTDIVREEENPQKPAEIETDEVKAREQRSAAEGKKSRLPQIRSLLYRFRKHFAIAAGLILLIVLASAFLAEKPEEKEGETYFYVKDNSLYGAVPLNGEAQEYTACYLEKWGSRSGGGLFSNEISTRGASPSGNTAGKLQTNPACSESGRYLYFPEKMEKGSYNLMRLDIKKGEAKTLDSGVTQFLPVGSEKVVYRKDNGAVYWYGENRKKKIAQEVSEYWVSPSEEALLWTMEEDGSRDLYYERLEEGGERIRLERNLHVMDVSEDLNTVLVQKEDRIYRIEAQGNPELLAGEVSEAAAGDAEDGSFYLVRTVDRTPSTSYQELYYFSNGEEQLLSDSFLEFYYQGEDTVVYRQDDGESCFLAYGGMIGELGRDPALPGQVELDNGRLYFMSPGAVGEKGHPRYELCYTELAAEKLGQIQEVDDGVSELACISDGRAYYYKEVKGAAGDLYCDGEPIIYDAAVGTAAPVPGGGVLCIGDYSEQKRRGTLLYADEPGGRAIAHDISGYLAISPEEILLLSGYSFDKERGDLLRYDGFEVSTVDTDIWGLYGNGSGRICR